MITQTINTQTITMFMQMFLSFANICVIGYGFYKFMNKPHDTLEERVNLHDLEIKEIKSSLLQGNDRFREQVNTNEVLIHAVMALIEFEIQYCLTEKKTMSKDLEKAKEDLHSFLSKNRGGI